MYEGRGFFRKRRQQIPKARWMSPFSTMSPNASLALLTYRRLSAFIGGQLYFPQSPGSAPLRLDRKYGAFSRGSARGNRAEERAARIQGKARQGVGPYCVQPGKACRIVSVQGPPGVVGGVNEKIVPHPKMPQNSHGLPAAVPPA